MVSSTNYFPEQGDVVWVDLEPVRGHQQGGRRPALVLSRGAYNRKVGLMIACPITTRSKGYPFEVVIPEGYNVKGVILADHVKSLDWKSRQVELINSLPSEVVEEVQQRLGPLLF